MNMRTTIFSLVLAIAIATAAVLPASSADAAPAKGNYAAVNGLKMYYEVHGQGAPLVLLHGGVCTIDTCFGKVLPVLAKNRRVIAIEQQGHGHTNDVAGRPLSFEQMADDTVALLGKLGIRNADFLGYSMGATTALRIAIKHPKLVRRLVFLASAHNTEGWEPAVLAGMAQLTPEAIPQLFRDAYAKAAPDPTKWATLVGKIKALVAEFKGYPTEQVRQVKAPVLIVLGDRDIIRAEYGVQLYRTLTNAQLAVLPGSDHFAVNVRADWVSSMSTTFLDAPEQPGQVATAK
jgi:pimeloyl-ACP methyl ester carboxylesterase